MPEPSGSASWPTPAALPWNNPLLANARLGLFQGRKRAARSYAAPGRRPDRGALDAGRRRASRICAPLHRRGGTTHGHRGRRTRLGGRSPSRRGPARWIRGNGSQGAPRGLGVDWLHQADALAADAGSGRSSAEVSYERHAEAAHNRGYECATALRRHLWPANGHAPVGDLDELLVRLGWAPCPSRTLELGPESRLEAALARSAEGGAVAIVGDAGRAANRFAIARTIFLHHFTASGRTHRRLATEAHTWEQRASRAFAAEFLAPATALSRHLGGRASASRIDELAHRYGVSSRAIGHQIENHRLAWIHDS